MKLRGYIHRKDIGWERGSERKEGNEDLMLETVAGSSKECRGCSALPLLSVSLDPLS